MKKIVFILGFIVFTSFGASAQIKYQGDRLLFNVDSYYENEHPYVSTFFQGDEHVFQGRFYPPAYFSIKPMGSVHLHTISVSIGSSGDFLRVMNPATYEYQDLHVGTIYQYSDKRAKTDVRTISGATNTLLKLKPVTYRFTNSTKSKSSLVAGADGRDTGFLAQEVATVLPNSVTTDADGNMLVNYTSIIPLLVKAIQEQQTEIQALKTEVANLKNK